MMKVVQMMVKAAMKAVARATNVSTIHFPSVYVTNYLATESSVVMR